MTARFAQGDIVVSRGKTALVWFSGASTLTVMPSSKASGPHHRSDVAIGMHTLSTVTGPLLVTTSVLWDWTIDDEIVVIGRITSDDHAAVLNAIAKEQRDRSFEASNPDTRIFTACQPRFSSGGRRVGVGARV